ncbi:hypothetical protein HaLaN_21908, partial [Haematococcus lacustris]
GACPQAGPPAHQGQGWGGMGGLAAGHQEGDTDRPGCRAGAAVTSTAAARGSL